MINQTIKKLKSMRKPFGCYIMMMDIDNNDELMKKWKKEHMVKEIVKEILNDYIKYSRSMIDDDLRVQDHWLNIFGSMEDFKRYYLNDLSEKEVSELAKIFSDYDNNLLYEFREYCGDRIFNKYSTLNKKYNNFYSNCNKWNISIKEYDKYVKDFLEEKRQKKELHGVNQPIFFENLPNNFNPKNDVYDSEYKLVDLNDYEIFLEYYISKFVDDFSYGEENITIDYLKKLSKYLGELINIKEQKMKK